jgi:YbbR domain-containing protein
LRLLTHNLWWKITSLALALGLWFAIVGEPDVATSILVPLQLENTPRSLEIASGTPTQVRLDVRGPEGRLTPAELGNVAVVIDLSEVNGPGERTIPIDASNVSLPNGVSLERAQPYELDLVLERRVEREVPVKLKVGVPPGPGLTLERAEIVPQSLLVSGPETHMRDVSHAETAPLDLSAIRGDAEIATHAFLNDSLVRFDRGSRVSVRVKIGNGKAEQ